MPPEFSIERTYKKSNRVQTSSLTQEAICFLGKEKPTTEELLTVGQYFLRAADISHILYKPGNNPLEIHLTDKQILTVDVGSEQKIILNDSSAIAIYLVIRNRPLS